MKKDINELVKRAVGRYRLNNLCYLDRWTKDALGDYVDGLKLCFDDVNGVNFGSCIDIKARDYEGIITECEAAINEFLKEVAERVTKDLKAGYRNATYR